MLTRLRRILAPNRRKINKGVTEEQIRAFNLLYKIASRYKHMDFRGDNFNNLTGIEKIKKFIQMVDNDIDIKALGEALNSNTLTLLFVNALKQHLNVVNNVRKIAEGLFLPKSFLTRIYGVDYFRDVFVDYLFKYTSIFLSEEIQKEIIKQIPAELESTLAPEGTGTRVGICISSCW